MNLFNTKLVEKMQDYEKAFEEFPTYPFINYADEKIIKIIDDCLKQKKDVYELGYLSLDWDY